MFRTRPFMAMPQALVLARTTLKLALGLFVLSFFLGYQPTFGFPPIKSVTVHAQAEQSQSVESQKLPLVFQLPHPGYLTTRFSSWHPGIDIPTGFGMPIKPIEEGVVTSAQFSFFGYGMMIEIDHGHDYKSLYAHLNRMFVKEGDKVSKDSLLGEVGLTGRTTGPHTHLEVSKNGVKIDPLTILPPIRQNPEAQDFVARATPSARLASEAKQAQFVGGPTKTPTLGNTKIEPISTPAQEVKKEEPKPTQPLTASDKLDLQKVFSFPASTSTPKLSFLNF